jgi:hypothetical protein
MESGYLRHRDSKTLRRLLGKNETRGEALLYLVAAVLSLAIIAVVMRLDMADLRVPFTGYGDGTFYQSVIIRPLITQPWYLVNQSIGAPKGLLLYDYPTGTDSLLYLIMKVIAVITQDSAVTLNVFYLLTYPLIAMTMLFAARSLRLRRSTAVAVALLFTFLPYHLIRAEGHLTLSAYFMLPIALLVALRPYATPLGASWDPADDHVRWAGWRSTFGNWRFGLRAAMSVVMGLTGVYYGFFYMVMLTVVAARRAVRERRWLPLLVPLVLAAITAGVIVASNAPTLIYQAKYGPNPQAAIRDARDAETFALRPVQLVLPVTNHRIGRLRTIAAHYQAFLAGFNPTFDNESRTAALGAAGALGFIFLLLWPVLASRKTRAGPGRWAHFGDLASINLVMLLLGTVGGIGFVIAYFVSPSLRGYNRVSVVIGMVALLALGALIDEALERLPRLPSWIAVAVAVVLVCAGVFDQSTTEVIPDYKATKAQNLLDRSFAASASKALPAGTAVFQLPYATFPGSDPNTPLPVGFDDYDHLVPNEYSLALRWSFPAMRGRPEAAWQKQVAALPAKQMLPALSKAGFTAVYVDRRGYEDAGTAIVGDLSAQLGDPVVKSGDGRRLIWKLPHG